MWNDNRVDCYSHLKTPCSSISPPSSILMFYILLSSSPFSTPGGVAPPPGDRRLWSWGSLEPQISLKSLLLPAPKSSHTGTQISSREKQISDDAMIKWTHIVTLKWTQPPRNISFDPVFFPGFLFLPICQLRRLIFRGVESFKQYGINPRDANRNVDIGEKKGACCWP